MPQNDNEKPKKENNQETKQENRKSEAEQLLKAEQEVKKIRGTILNFSLGETTEKTKDDD